MSEVIENYIRRNPGLSEKEAFAGFLNEERIKAWVGTDESRKERLRREFGRAWGSMQDTVSHTGARAGPSGPTMQQPRSVRVETPVRPVEDTPAPSVAQEPVLAPRGTPGAKMVTPAPHGSAAVGGGRKLQVLCTNCKRIEVYMDAEQNIRCRRCGFVYEDMLQLIRVKPVGPLEFYFGEGWKGVATAGGLAVGLVLLYIVLRWR